MSGRAFRQQVKVFVDSTLAPEARSRFLAEAAIRGRDELIRSGRASQTFQTFVDGQAGASEFRVKPEGMIVYRFSVLGQAAVFAMDYLVRRSPLGSAKKLSENAAPFSGHYRDQFVYAIGERMTKFKRRTQLAEQFSASRIIRPESFDPQKVDAEVAEIVIVNRSPYARKVDVQLVGGKRLAFKVPPGIFDDAAAAVRRRFPALNARRVYQMHFPGQYTLRQAQMRKGTMRLARRIGTPVENPALVISVR